MSSVKRERCPECNSLKLINNILIEEGQPLKVYVECSECHAFVARYTVNCYTSNERYESLLNYLPRNAESGRAVSRKVKAFDECIKNEFEQCKNMIREREEDKRIEEIISEKEDKK